jgi:trimethylamine:corrinoid methyltransferase-like protein
MLFAGIDFKSDFLKQKLTRQLFPQEQYLPSLIIYRGSMRTWQETGSSDAFARAKIRAAELLAAYQRPALPIEQERELRQLVSNIAHNAGMDNLPAIENF